MNLHSTQTPLGPTYVQRGRLGPEVDGWESVSKSAAGTVRVERGLDGLRRNGISLEGGV